MNVLFEFQVDMLFKSGVNVLFEFQVDLLTKTDEELLGPVGLQMAGLFICVCICVVFVSVFVMYFSDSV